MERKFKANFRTFPNFALISLLTCRTWLPRLPRLLPAAATPAQRKKAKTKEKKCNFRLFLSKSSCYKLYKLLFSLHHHPSPRSPHARTQLLQRPRHLRQVLPQLSHLQRAAARPVRSVSARLAASWRRMSSGVPGGFLQIRVWLSEVSSLLQNL